MIEPDLVAYAHEVLCEVSHRLPLPSMPTIEWRRYRVTAGMAYYKIGMIGLSNSVLKDREMVRDTVLHEYAHLLAVARHGPKAAGHGPHWRQAMRELGLPPKVRHNYEVERNTPRQRVTYKCLSCGKLIHRSRRLPRRRQYIHLHCGGDLRLVKVEPATQTLKDS